MHNHDTKCLQADTLSVAGIKTKILTTYGVANIWLVSSIGRAPARQSGGRRFKSRSSKLSLFIKIISKNVPSQFSCCGLVRLTSDHSQCSHKNCDLLCNLE